MSNTKKKKISVLMDADVHSKLKKLQSESDLVSISATIRKLLNTK